MRNAARRSTAEIRAWCVEALAAEAGLPGDRVDVDEPFAAYGLGSRQLVAITARLEQWLGRPLPPTLAWEHPTVERLARHLAGEPAPEPRSVPPARGGEEPIAVVGLACRFPGAPDAAAFWTLLRDGVDAVDEVPGDRWDADAFHDSAPGAPAPGRMNTRWGGFLDRIDEFDAAFFGIAPREAARMDPQQRLLLEVAWEALEDAGQPADRLAGTRAGVFVGISAGDYGQLQLSDPGLVDPYVSSGNALSIAANRISYFLDLRGPSVAVDTACSASLVAVHLAIESLRSGDASLAVVGGVNVILSPSITVSFSQAGATSPDGRCRAFDADANGVARGEGAGVVVLKPLGRALADSDRIRAVIRGSAVNQDGRTNGLTAPSPQAQEEVLAAACERAGVPPASVDYVEAHGAGTLLGDPIEARALGAVLGRGRAEDRPCAIGSVKTNVGHLEAAAGIAGLIKTILALEHGQLPPSLHFRAPNPYIPFDELGLRVQRELGEWPAREGPRRAGVSSFGFGGTNAHVVLEEAPPQPRAHRDDPGRAALLTLSAGSEPALRELARAHAALLGRPDAAPLADVCHTAAARRTHHRHRVAAVAESAGEAAELLAAFVGGERPRGIATAVSAAEARPVFVLPGHGGHWPGMARALLSEPVFRQAIEECDERFREYFPSSVVETLEAPDAASPLGGDELEAPQTTVFAVHVALAALWRSWGVEPAAVVGHSAGEAVAAFVAGALPLAGAVEVAARRLEAFRTRIGGGAMAAVGLSWEEALAAVAPYAGRVSVAAHHGPTSTVLSGDADPLHELAGALERRGAFVRVLRSAGGAGHSAHADPLQPVLASALAGLAPRETAIPLYSTVTGRRIDGRRLDADYWGRNIREPIRFAETVAALAAAGHTLFLELSPHPVLVAAVVDCLDALGREGAALGSLRRGDHRCRTLATSLGELYVRGATLRFERVARGRAVSLPAYPWQRRRHWFDPREARGAATAPPARVDGHPLLGAHVTPAESPGTHVWEAELSEASLGSLSDHRVQGRLLLAGTAYVEAALAAVDQALGPGPRSLEDVRFRQPLFVDPADRRRVQVALAREGDDARVRIYSRPAGRAGDWKLHASATACRARAVGPRADPPETVRDRLADEIPVEPYYAALRRGGLEYGPAFRALRRLWRGRGEALGLLEAPRAVAAELGRTSAHPALLDAALQVLGAALVPAPTGAPLPTRIARVRVHRPLTTRMWSHARAAERPVDGGTAWEGDVRVVDDAGNLLAEVDGFRLEDVVGRGGGPLRASAGDSLYTVVWEPRARDAEEKRSPDGVLVLGDAGGAGEALAARLAANAVPVAVVAAGKRFRRTAPGRFVAHPGSDTSLGRVLDALGAAAASWDVVHLWSLDAAAGETLGVDDLERSLAHGSGSVVSLVQALVRRGARGRLWLVTRGAQPAEPGEDVAVAQAPLWGLGRAVLHEHPALVGALVDTDPGASAAEIAEGLAAELFAVDGESQIAFRDGTRLAARLARRPARPHRGSLACDPDATYLVTGGLGDLGLVVARRLAVRGARRLVLLSRSGLPERSSWNAHRADPRVTARIEAVRELEGLGARVRTAAVDVANEAALRALLDDLRGSGWSPIRGVVHAAGVAELRTVLELGDRELRAALQAKVTGGWLLHRLLEREPLDLFVLFSSFASLVPSPRLGAYAAGNAFLDALAHHRRARSLPALSVNWGAWADRGMGARHVEAGHVALQGAAAFTPDEALAVLERLLAEDETQAGFALIDWAEWKRRYPSFVAAPLFARVAPPDPARRPAATAPGRLRDALRDAEPAARAPLLERYLREQVGAVLGLSADAVPTEQPLTSLGLDSLMGVELKKRVEDETAIPIQVMTLLAGPTVAGLAQELAASFGAGAPAPPVARPTSGPRVDSLSDEDVAALLEELLPAGPPARGTDAAADARPGRGRPSRR